MTRMVRIFTDLVFVPLTQKNEETSGERDDHQKIRVNLSDLCHPCAITGKGAPHPKSKIQNPKSKNKISRCDRSGRTGYPTIISRPMSENSLWPS